ncbi:hypothetical protein CAC42_7732 [Sphaceloma murrayae]|uniref:Inclusion body clearance protein IML2 n=1 Tax=Sphaceloma murrayae TaxID=2082308 RepID=A0A2K1QXH8_9PEZI|nr:hypothetical protein CAC42_7732 [Sphaceloma murrayae]
MKSIGHFLGSRSQTGSTSSLTALEEPAALQDAMVAAACILNDEFDQAEEGLSKGNSPFHKLGKGVLAFLKATIGFEQDIMKEASELLAEAETAASEHQRRAHKDAYRSAIYPAGSEYALVYAESQLMSAVVGVLNESLTEAIKGFYRLRRAYTTLQEIAEAEKKYLKSRSSVSVSSRPSTDSRGSANPKSDLLSPISAKSTGLSPAQSGRASPLNPNKPPASDEDADSDLDFVDADDALDASNPSDTYAGNLVSPMSALKVSTPTFDPSVLAMEELSNPIDLFIHTGTSLCFGLLQLILSLVPPTFSRLLSIVGFRGDRDSGLSLLWSATKHPENLNGALAGLIVLGYYSNMVNFVDILGSEAYPREECKELLARMRERYPKSRFWLLEESRMIAGERRPEEAVDLLLRYKEPAPLKQIEALKWFECSLNWMYTGEFEKCAEGFIKCVDLNNWSPALYYYIAASCYIELYRAALLPSPSDSPSTSSHRAAKYKSRATELLALVPTKAGKKRFMARQLPFDAYVARKVAKWEAEGKRRSLDPVDAAGVSPVSEMAYFWSGWKRMSDRHLEGYLGRVEGFMDSFGVEAGIGDGEGEWEEGTARDETLVYWVLKAIVVARMGRREEAREILQGKVVGTELVGLKAEMGPLGESWVLPVGIYELGVVDWEDYRALEEKGEGKGKRGQELLMACKGRVEKVAKWESYDLDTRIGLKIRGAQETLRKAGAA